MARCWELVYRDPAGTLGSELLYRDRKATIEIAETGRPWSFDGDGALFRLVSEDHRIQLVTKNEILTALNKPDDFALALVLIDGETVDEPVYLQRPFRHEPDFAVTAVNYEMDKLLGGSEANLAVRQDAAWPQREILNRRSISYGVRHSIPKWSHTSGIFALLTDFVGASLTSSVTTRPLSSLACAMTHGSAPRRNV